jgi:hypothetical protein
LKKFYCSAEQKHCSTRPSVGFSPPHIHKYA